MYVGKKEERERKEQTNLAQVQKREVKAEQGAGEGATRVEVHWARGKESIKISRRSKEHSLVLVPRVPTVMPTSRFLTASGALLPIFPVVYSFDAYCSAHLLLFLSSQLSGKQTVENTSSSFGVRPGTECWFMQREVGVSRLVRCTIAHPLSFAHAS